MRVLAAALAVAIVSLGATAAAARPGWALVIHGGAGVIDRKDLNPEQEAAYRQGLTTAAEAGAKVLGVARRTVRANQQREALAKDARRAHVEKGEIQFTNEKA